MTKHTYKQLSQTQWQQHIEDQIQSNLSIVEYCKQHQLTPSRFYTWRAKLNITESQTSKPSEQAEEDWLAIPTGLSAPASLNSAVAMTLSLPGGITLTLKPV